MTAIRVVHYLNQFFAGIGGEAKADLEPHFEPGPVGAGRALAHCLAPDATVVGTLICGDDAFNTNRDRSVDVLAEFAGACRPDVLVAGPAFDAGRYGLACAVVCSALGRRFAIPTVTAMTPANPGRALHARDVYVLPTAGSALGMRSAVERLAAFAVRLGRREEIGPAESDGYLPRGRRLNVLDGRTAAERAVDLLVRQLGGAAVESEIPPAVSTPWQAAPPLADPRTACVALVTAGGIVPRGNPDRIESRHATRWLKYPIDSLGRLEASQYECVHSGFDTAWVSADPQRVLPVDVGRALERERQLGRLHPEYYVTTGVSTPIETGQRFGREMAEDLLRQGVTGVIMTAT